jgi:hypothetical protein
MSRRNGRVATVAASIVATLLLASGCSTPPDDLAVPGIDARGAQPTQGARFPVEAAPVPRDGVAETTEGPAPAGSSGGGMGRPDPAPVDAPSLTPTGSAPTSTPAPVPATGAVSGASTSNRASGTVRPAPTTAGGSPTLPVVAKVPEPVPPVPVERKAQEVIPLPEPVAVVAAGGAVWVKQGDGALAQVDPATNLVVNTITTTAVEPCHGFGGVGNILWTCAGQGVASRIDPVTGTVTHRVNIDKTPEQRLIPMAFDHAWFLVAGGTQLVGVSHAENAVGQPIDLGARCVAVDATEAALWVACPDTGEVLKVDPGAKSVVARIGGLPGARAVSGGGYVFVGFESGTARIDRTTATVTAAVASGPSDARGSLYTAGNLVYVRTPQGDLEVFDTATMKMVERIAMSEVTSGASTVLAFGSLWTTSDSGELYRLRAADETTDSSSSSATPTSSESSTDAP